MLGSGIVRPPSPSNLDMSSGFARAATTVLAGCPRWAGFEPSAFVVPSRELVLTRDAKSPAIQLRYARPAEAATGSDAKEMASHSFRLSFRCQRSIKPGGFRPVEFLGARASSPAAMFAWRWRIFFRGACEHLLFRRELLRARTPALHQVFVPVEELWGSLVHCARVLPRYGRPQRGQY